MADHRPENQASEMVEAPTDAYSSHRTSRRTSNDSSRSDPEQGLDLQRTASHVSTTHDAAIAEHAADSRRGGYQEAGDEIYDKFSPRRKLVVVSVLSICSFLAPISSTSILAAAPEVVETFHTTGGIFGVSNALYMIFMGVSPLIYGPMGTAFGRRWPLIIAAVTFTAFSVGTALAPNLPAYFTFRILSALQGTCFLIVGSLQVVWRGR